MENQHDDHDDVEEKSSGVGGSRWNPTKEQIEMLEKMYSNEGVRTPSAEQIQQITTRLRVYGHIEGKNVFYWFQNHKARQRQKQRHERLLAAVAINNPNHHFSHHHYFPNNINRPPLFPTSHLPAAFNNHHYLPNPNVICNPYYHQLPQANLGLYNPLQHHKSAPAVSHHHDDQTIKQRPISKPMNHQITPRGGDRRGVPPSSTLSGYCTAMMNSRSMEQHEHSMEMTTLDLFPIHPTGILEHKHGGYNNSSGNSSANTSSSSDTIIIRDNDKGHQFYDFFSSSESG
ncbi:unnamed protein product [Amaranthus hypochondriacus]